jgi:tRNA-specific 2-thiouridylase
LFPIGNFKSKREVREVAAKLGLPTAQTTESNDVCFLQNIDIDSFLQSYGDGLRKVGKITTKDGEAIGEHQGLCFYTIGQRKGIGLSDGPWFVIAKDIKKNTLVVSKNEKDLLQKELIAENINWISGVEPKLPLKVRAKVRYRSELSSATIVEKMGKARYKIIFINSQRAVTCGQSVVFYRGDELLGGGIIS